MIILLYVTQLAVAVPYDQLKNVRKTIRENRRHYLANAKMFDRINKQLEAYENRTQFLEDQLSQVNQELDVVKAENMNFKADIKLLKLNNTADYDYNYDYPRFGC